MNRWLSKFLNWIDTAEQRELERYLAQSASPADLERRMREWDNRQQGFNHLP
jgi:hypothetical protein